MVFRQFRNHRRMHILGAVHVRGQPRAYCLRLADDLRSENRELRIDHRLNRHRLFVRQNEVKRESDALIQKLETDFANVAAVSGDLEQEGGSGDADAGGGRRSRT